MEVNLKTQNLKLKKCSIRYLREIKSVVYDKAFAKQNPNLELYYMHREVKKYGEIRYDITIIPAQMLGKEFVRTKGNQNSDKLAELYTVLSGKAIFLMQKTEKGVIKDVVAVQVKKGEFVNAPGDYAVIVINPTKKELKLANWVSEKNKNIYKDLEKMKGACYFYTTDGWIKNKNYKKVPKLRFEKPLKEKPKSLDFLKAQ